MRYPARTRGAIVAAALLLVPAMLTAQQTGGKTDKDKKKDLPLEPTRTIEFAAERGSWISVDVSPDGSTLLFDLLGDLYTMPIQGGAATRLTSGMAYDAQPRFSPDGERIVFVSDRSGGENVWILSLDGRDTVQVSKGNDNLYHSPEWTPDGEYVVASKSSILGGAAKLWLYHVKGGSGIAMIKDPEPMKVMGAAFGPDPRYVWFARRTGDWSYNAVLPQYQLAVYDRETGRTTTMTDRWGSGFRPTLSPDGKWLVYGTRHGTETGLVLRDLESGAERWLAYPVQRDEQESRATMDVLPGMSFTPDSRAVVASYGGEIWRVPVDGSAAERIPFRADVALGLGPLNRFDYRVEDDAALVVRQIRDGVPSPDGTRYAFTALNRLHVMALPDGTPRRIAEATDGQFYPTWSPDGRWIAYVTWTDAGGGHVWKTRADGRGRPERLTRAAADYRQLAWAPDGRRIVAVRAPARRFQEAANTYTGGGPGADFVWVPAEGGDATRITPTGGRGTPHFAGDAERIFAYGSDGLVSFRWDGTDEKRHLKVTGHTPPNAKTPMPADAVLMGPDRTRAIASVSNDLYLVTVPLVGPEGATISVVDPSGASVPARRLTDVGGQFPAWSADGGRVHWSIGNAHFVYDIARADAVEDSIRAARRVQAAAGDSASAAADSARAAAEKKDEGYEPTERRIRITAERDIPRGAAVLRGARIVTMKGAEVIESGDVVVRDNRIVAVGPSGSVQVPEGARVIDVAGKTIVPGFVDTHAHMWPAWGVHRDQVWMYLANLAYGVTTTRDPQTARTDVLTYSDRVETGDLIGPRIYSTGPGVFPGYIELPLRDADHARDVLRRYSDYYDTKTIKMYMAGNRRQRQWIAQAATELKLTPTTEGGLEYKLDLTHVIDGYAGIEHNLPVAPLYEDVVELFARAGTINTPTLLVNYGGPWGENYWFARERAHQDVKLQRFTPRAELDAKTRRRGAGWFAEEEYAFPRHAEFARDVMQEDGCVGVGSHGQLQGLGYHWELWSVQSGGMAPHDALRAATLCGARAIGLDTDLGSIEPGKLADLVVLDADPLQNIRNTNTVRYVMKNGRLYEGASLDEVWPRQRPLEQRWWVAPEPQTKAGIR